MSILMGMNLDLVYQGQTFHIQTEDSGLDHPVVITHLFKAGRILHTQSHHYKKLIHNGKVDETEIRRVMKNQHLKMIQDLESGQLDRLLLTSSHTPPPQSNEIPLARRSSRTRSSRTSRSSRSRSSRSSHKEDRSLKTSSSIQSKLSASSLPQFQMWSPFLSFQSTLSTLSIKQCLLNESELLPSKLKRSLTQVSDQSDESQ